MRFGPTGRCSPASSATVPDHAPAAFTKCAHEKVFAAALDPPPLPFRPHSGHGGGEPVTHPQLPAHRHPGVCGHVWINHPVPRPVGGARQPLRLEVHVALRLHRVDHLDGRSQALLQRDRLQVSLPLVVGDQQQIADVPVADFVSVALRELPVHGQGVHGKPDVGDGGELHAHAGGAPAGRAHGGRHVHLGHQHAQPAAGQVPGAGGAHDAGAGDDDVGVLQMPGSASRLRGSTLVVP